MFVAEKKKVIICNYSWEQYVIRCMVAWNI